MNYTLKTVVKDLLVYLIMCVATFLMLRTIIGYAGFSSTYAFLQQKQDYLYITVWRVAFYVHVFTSLLTLAAGFTQFSSSVLKYNKRLHRLVGKLYIVLVIFINVPAGFVMAIYANGNWPGKLAFLILDGLWFWFTWKAWRSVLNKDYKAHREFMIRSYALTFSAITLRTWKIILSSLFILDPLTLYQLDAWMGFVPNLLFAEWLIRKSRNRKTKSLSANFDIVDNK